MDVGAMDSLKACCLQNPVCCMVGAVASIVVIYLIHQYRKRVDYFRHFEKLGIPGPKPSLWFGNMREMQKEGHLKCLQKWHKEHGPIIGYFFGMNPLLAVADVELLKLIEIKEFIDFADRPTWITGAGTGIHDSALTALKGQNWKNVRSTLTPSFTSSKLKALNAEVIAVVDQFMDNVAGFEGKEIEIYSYIQALTMDTICKTALGVDYDIQKDVPNHPILVQAKIMFESGGSSSSVLGLILSSVPFLRPIARMMYRMDMKKKAKSAGTVDPIRQLRKTCDQIVAARRADTNNTRMDLLQLMIDAQGDCVTDLQSLTVQESDESAAAPACPVTGASAGGKKLTQQEVVDNAFLVLLAGYETTSSSLAFISRLLLRFPEVQDRLREELMQATDNGRTFDFDALQKCHYLEAVIQETIRMYPPIHGFTMREASSDKTLNGVRIPKGQAVMASTHELHHREEYFPSPYEFQPERFLPENRHQLTANAWQPFGAGPRNCIGMRFAQMEMKITLAKLLTRYRLTSASEPKGDAHIEVVCANPVMQRIKDPIICTVEKL